MLRTLFIAAILIPGFYAALRSPYCALLVYLWFALFRPQEWMWIDITAYRPSLVLGIVLLVPALLTGRFPNVTHPLSLGMVLFLGAAVLSQITAVDPQLGWDWIDFCARLFVACLLLVTLTGSAPRLLGAIAVIAGSLGFHAAKAGVAYALGGGTRFADGLAGAFIDNNGYALGTVMIMPLLIVTAQNVEILYSGRWAVWLRRGWLAAAAACVLAVIGTYSRGGFLALAVATLVFIALQRRRAAALLMTAAVVGLALLVAPIPDSYIERVRTIRTYNQIEETSALSRQHFWRVGLQMGLDNPLGVGLRQYESAYDRYDATEGRYGTRRSVHSAHVQVFAELGILGALIWVGLFAYAAALGLRMRARAADPRLPPPMQRLLFTTANGLLTSMAAFMVGGAFIALALNDLTWLIFALLASLDRLSQSALSEPAVAAPARPPAAGRTPLAFRAVSSVAAAAPREDAAS